MRNKETIDMLIALNIIDDNIKVSYDIEKIDKSVINIQDFLNRCKKFNCDNTDKGTIVYTLLDLIDCESTREDLNKLYKIIEFLLSLIGSKEGRSELLTTLSYDFNLNDINHFKSIDYDESFGKIIVLEGKEYKLELNSYGIANFIDKNDKIVLRNVMYIQKDLITGHISIATKYKKAEINTFRLEFIKSEYISF